MGFTTSSRSACTADTLGNARSHLNSVSHVSLLSHTWACTEVAQISDLTLYPFAQVEEQEQAQSAAVHVEPKTYNQTPEDAQLRLRQMHSGASVLAGVLDIIESVLGARIGPDQLLMEVLHTIIVSRCACALTHLLLKG